MLLAKSLLALALLGDDPLWVEYEGPGDLPGSGKRGVLVAGDEEYRSEEALPQLGRILAQRHGFRCRVVFSIDPETGEIDPDERGNIPGLEALGDADLMIIATRFRDLADEQMEHVDAYLRRGGAVLGMRTATHAFKTDPEGRWAHYADGYRGPNEAWRGGFGRLVLGERWITHHGRHGVDSTLGVVPEDAREHPILRGIGEGTIWGPSDVYGVRTPLGGDARVLVLGRVLARRGEPVAGDPMLGMRPDDPAVEGEKNEPMMPIAWTRTYRIPEGEKGRAFTTTMGASTELVAEGTRRLLVHAAYDLVGLDVPADGADVRLVGDYAPTRFAFGGFTRGRRPADHVLDEAR